jgi:type VI secretion system protein ImpH
MPSALELHQRLLVDAARFDFFQALRLIECAHPALPRIGQSLRPQDDAVRFGQTPALAFAGNAIDAFEAQAEGRPPRLTVNFLGLFGPNGPMPLHLTEYARDRLRNEDDPTLARFLDVFHHRMVSLFYRAWANAQPTVNLDRGEQDRFSVLVASLFGQGMDGMRERDAVPDAAKLHFAGRLACQSRSADGLRAILCQFLALPVQIEQFVGGWLALSPEIRSRLGGPGLGGALGVSVVLGAQVWDTQHKFRIVIGPLDFADYRRLLPGGDSLKRVVAWVRNYLGDSLAWDLRLILRHDAVPPLMLGAGAGAQLGWTSWCAAPDAAARSRPADRADLILQPLPS